MIKVLFICHGNICRSPMAEFYMKHIVRAAGLEKKYIIESKATSTEEIGNSIYPNAARELKRHGIGCNGHVSRQLKRSDYDAFDYLIVMDSANVRNTERICGGDSDDKIHMLLEYVNRPGESVADPWYTRDFEQTWEDVSMGCDALLEYLESL